MEMMRAGRQIIKWMHCVLYTCLLILIVQVQASAQPVKKLYTIKKGKMYIELSRKINEADLNNFIRQYNLSELGLKGFISKNTSDSITRNGWYVETNNDKFIAISKPLLSSDKILKPGEQLVRSIAERFPRTGNGLVMGVNKFKRNRSFVVKDSLVQFFLSGYPDARRVVLAGSFNNFSPNRLAMQKTNTGWIANVVLKPGKYWYKFIWDGNWISDPDNEITEDDGEGNTNSVFYKTNTRFYLKGHLNAKKVFLAGSFNNWQRKDLPMMPTPTGWELPLYLANGTYTYRFVADGDWFADPDNLQKMPNEFGEYNSVIRLGKPYLFRLNGFTAARRVILTGSFNGWRKDELFLNKTGTGWELLYTLGEGNYEYRFIVDGTEITDPGNPVLSQEGREKANSILVLGANYRFRLRGFPRAKNVILAGDFNNFNEHAFVMNREGDAWVYPVYLAPGKHIYKFIVDGEWILDPGNKLWEQNEYGTGNSVIWIDSEDNVNLQ